jgi:DNA invertase Pin-like site-specific DNA recombinase
MKKAIAYVRVSSDEQTKANGIPEQSANAEAYCARNGLNLVETLVDDGYSASKGYHLSKGKLGRFRADAAKGKYKGYALVVSETDRLSRQGIREARKLIDGFIEAEVEIHVTQTGRVIRETEDLFTDIMNSLESHGAAEYSRRLRERNEKAWAAKKRNAGSKVVTSRVPFWLKVQAEKIVEIPAKVTIVKEMFRLAALGLGAKRISAKTGVPLATMQNTLANRAVLGEYQPQKNVNGKRVPDGDPLLGYFPVIITPSEWKTARTEIDRKNRMPDGPRRFCSKNDGAANLFSGLLYDATAAPIRTLFFQKQSSSLRTTPEGGSRISNHSAFLVSQWQPNRKYNRLKYADFETAFLEFLKDLDWQSIANEGKNEEETELEKQLNVKLAELDRLERRVTKIKAAMDAEDVEPGGLGVLARKLDADETFLVALASEQEALQASLETVKAKTAALEDVDALKEALRDLSNVELRLRARTEIRKRVSSIRFAFTEEFGVVAYVSFINGSGCVITVLGDKAMINWLEPSKHSDLLEWVETVKIIDL